MKKTDFESFAGQMGFKSPDERMCAGLMDEWLVMAVNGQKRMTLTIAADVRTEDGRGKKQVKESLKGSGLSLARWLDRNIVLSVPGESISTDVLKADVQTALSVMKSNGIKPVRQCPVCGKPYPDRAGFVGSSYLPVHRSCLEEYDKNGTPVTSEGRENQPYANGVMGMLLAVAVIFVLAVLMSRVLTFTFILIPLLTFYIYGRSGGKTDSRKKVGVYISLVSLIGFFLAILLISSFDLYRNGSYSFIVALGAMIRIMSTGIIQTLIKNIVPAVITIVGIMLAIFGVSSNARRVEKGSSIASRFTIDL